MLKIQSDRVIIDGHEPTKEQCETMTLLANALAESESFKTVKYESGYAEFEKVGKADELKFAIQPQTNYITISFDSHITKVVCSNYEWTTSGNNKNMTVTVGAEYVFTVTFENGYILDTVTSSVNGGVSTVVTNRTDTTFSISAGTNGTSFAITLTSKLAVSRKSVDLTTLSGWSSLSTGSHSITIVAKAEGYRDSEPSVAVSVTKAPQEYTDCITFTGESSDFTLAVGSNGAKEWDGTVQYSTDHNTWTTWNGTAVSSVNKKLYLRGSGNTKFYTSKGAQLSLSAKAACSGNIQTLLEYSNPPTSIPTTSCYRAMFYGCTNLTTAPELPATTLTAGCYYIMFQGCTSLTQAPELPATTLATNCYSYMFAYCTSLTQAPVLPATTLATNCYSSMFNGCTSLTQAPVLPATTLADSCYSGMFYGCASLKISETQSSEYPAAWRIPSSGTISSTPTSWNRNMLAGTGGTFTSNPNINTTYYGAWTSATPTLISFTIEGTSYQAEEGMTWEQWVNSSYNTGDYTILNNMIYSASNGNFIWYGSNHELATNIIIANREYYRQSGGSAN